MSEFQISREDFIRVGRSPPDTEHEILIAVKKPNIEIIEQRLIERATPGNANYQQWLTIEEIDQYLEGTKDEATPVLQWCREQPGLKIVDMTRRFDFIKVTAPIHRWEALLQTKFFTFEDHSFPIELEMSDNHSDIIDETQDQSSPPKLNFDNTLSANERLKRSRRRSARSQHPVFHRAEHYTIPPTLLPHVMGLINTVQTPPRYQAASHGININDPQIVQQLQQKRRQAATATAAASAETPQTARDNRQLRGPFGWDDRSSIELRMRSLDASNPTSVTVSFINDYYGVDSNNGDHRFQQSVFATSTEHFSNSDLAAFQSHFGFPDMPGIVKNGHATNQCPPSGSNSTMTCKEGNLDMQYLSGTAQNTTTIFWWVPSSSIDPFTLWSVLVANETSPPTSHAISWGSIEFLQSPVLMTLFNIEAMLLASMGVTIVVSSGDDGAPNYLTSTGTCLCENDSGSHLLSWRNSLSAPFSGQGYFPSFPATSPYVTAVGATMGPETGDTEIAAQSQLGGVITSGGGFSVFFATPSWQSSTVKEYLREHAPSKTGYNANGRGYPDVSLIGVDYAVMMNGGLITMYGTSCVAPVFAGWVSLINAQRRRAGLNTTIGWLNPTLYHVGYNTTHGMGTNVNATFNDVISGHNRCCHANTASGEDARCCASGFTAECGWDPVTGWGSIDFPALKHMFLPSSSSPSTTTVVGMLYHTNYTCPTGIADAKTDDSNPSVSAVVVVTTLIMLMMFLCSSIVAYTISIVRARRIARMRIHVAGGSGDLSSPVMTVATYATNSTISSRSHTVNSSNHAPHPYSLLSSTFTASPRYGGGAGNGGGSGGGGGGGRLSLFGTPTLRSGLFSTLFTPSRLSAETVAVITSEAVPPVVMATATILPIAEVPGAESTISADVPGSHHVIQPAATTNDSGEHDRVSMDQLGLEMIPTVTATAVPF